MAVALVTESVLQSPIRPILELECYQNGISLLWHCVTHDCSHYAKLFRQHRNVIGWNVKLSHRWMTQWDRNVLFIENSLLSQGSGAFVDHGGFFSHSNLCVLQTWMHEYSVDLAAFTKANFRWEPMAGGNPDGPILACLQHQKDSNLNSEFPLAKEAPDKVGAFIDILREYLPSDREVILRPHPRFIPAWEEGLPSYNIDPRWKVSWSENFYDLLPQCAALVTVNSTCASEALSLGIPVATLGMGAFSGTEATLECFHDPRLIGGILDWKPDRWRCERYCKAILGRHYLSYTKPDPKNAEIQAWIRAAF